MKNLKSESGRSMVEMLGVLAIIGVLSVGGIAGYNKAMSMYQTAKALQLLDMFNLSVKEASDSDQATPYDQKNSHPNCFCWSTQYFCDVYLGADTCSAFKTTDKTTYKVKSYHGLDFFIYNGGGNKKVTLNITNATVDTCKAVVERAYQVYYDDLPDTGSVFNTTFTRDDYKKAMEACDEESTFLSVKFNYTPWDTLQECPTDACTR